MAAVNPSETSQPALNDAYKTQGNPASKEPTEQNQANLQAGRNEPLV